MKVGAGRGRWERDPVDSDRSEWGCFDAGCRVASEERLGGEECVWHGAGAYLCSQGISFDSLYVCRSFVLKACFERTTSHPDSHRKRSLVLPRHKCDLVQTDQGRCKGDDFGLWRERWVLERALSVLRGTRWVCVVGGGRSFETSLVVSNRCRKKECRSLFVVVLSLSCARTQTHSLSRSFTVAAIVAMARRRRR